MPPTPRVAHPRPAAPTTRLLIGSVFAALAAALPMHRAQAADAPTLEARLQQLVDRLQQLEQRNQALERQVQALGAGKPPQATAADTWRAALDASAQQVEPEPRALRQDVQSPARPAEVEATDDTAGPTVEIGVITVAQQINAGGADAGRRESRLNYRGDVVVSWPLGSVAGAPGTAVGQLRFGQGGGVRPRPTYTGAVNSSSFEAAADPTKPMPSSRRPITSSAGHSTAGASTSCRATAWSSASARWTCSASSTRTPRPATRVRSS